MTAPATAATCHVCGSALSELWATAADIEYGSTSDRFDYFLCTRCDALSIDPLPLDRLSEIYPSTYYSFASAEAVLDPGRNAITKVKNKLDARTFKRILGHVGASDVRVLDVGGGTGDIAATLVAQAGPGASGAVVDIDETSIEVARKRGLDGFLGRFEDFKTDEKFDVIVMLNVIEHVSSPPAMLERARELLTDRGVIWLQTPNFRALDATLFRNKSWAGLHCPRHWVVFSDEGLRKAFDAADLETVEFVRSQGGAFWAASVLGRGKQDVTMTGALPRPLTRHPLFMPLAAVGAGFDLVTKAVRRTSQTTVIARRPR